MRNREGTGCVKPIDRGTPPRSDLVIGLIMAKATDILTALAALESLGVSLTPEQLASIEDAKGKAMHGAAEKVFKAKLTDAAGDDASVWVDRMFDLANEMEQVKAITRQQGRGSITERMFAIDTPNGRLKVSLSETVES
jgi:hypothetical protein